MGTPASGPSSGEERCRLARDGPARPSRSRTRRARPRARRSARGSARQVLARDLPGPDRRALLQRGQVVQLGHGRDATGQAGDRGRVCSRACGDGSPRCCSWLPAAARLPRIRLPRLESRRRPPPARRPVRHPHRACATPTRPPPRGRHRRKWPTRAGASSPPTGPGTRRRGSPGARVMIGYGCNAAPYYDHDPRCPGAQGFHHGIDVAMPCGTPLFAAVAGTVVDPSSSGSTRTGVRRAPVPDPHRPQRHPDRPHPARLRPARRPGRQGPADRPRLRQRRPGRLPPALRGAPPRWRGQRRRRPGAPAPALLRRYVIRSGRSRHQFV